MFSKLFGSQALGFLRKNERLYVVALVLIAAIIYFATKTNFAVHNQYVLLANAFLHGRLDIKNPGPWLELAQYEGRYYVINPPMPAVLLLPFVAIFGSGFDQSILSVVLGAIIVGLTYTMLRHAGTSKQLGLWISVLMGFGTNLWWASADGTSWTLAHVSAVFFLTMAVIESLGKRRAWLMGLLLGFATLSRLPVFLCFPYFLVMIHQPGNGLKALRRIWPFLLGLAVPLSLNMAYNYMRFGDVGQTGYFQEFYMEEPWFSHGRFNILYIPRHIYAIFFQGPMLLEEFPYFKPSFIGLGLFFTTPAFLYAFLASKNGLTLSAALGILCILPPLITHGTTGWSQFGYRYSLDFIPFLAILTAKGMKGRVGLLEATVILVSILVNLWGVLCFFRLNLVGV